MTTMSALAVDSLLLRELPGSAGAVHSVFAHVVNIATGDDLWSLAARRVPAGPRTVRLPLDDLRGLGLTAGTPVAVREESMTVGGTVVDLAGADRWEPERFAARVDPSRLAVAATALERLGVPGGARAGTDPFSIAVAERIADGLARIAVAVAEADIWALRTAVAGLVGLGAGLTPAGDDVLTGLAFAAARLGGRLAAIPAAVLAAVPGSTHVVSATALRQACAGRAVQPLSDLLAAICGERDPDLIADTVAALVAIGHTSGTDLAHGLVAAARLHQPHTTTK
jgi:hypothetical protein